LTSVPGERRERRGVPTGEGKGQPSSQKGRSLLRSVERMKVPFLSIELTKEGTTLFRGGEKKGINVS